MARPPAPARPPQPAAVLLSLTTTAFGLLAVGGCDGGTVVVDQGGGGGPVRAVSDTAASAGVGVGSVSSPESAAPRAADAASATDGTAVVAASAESTADDRRAPASTERTAAPRARTDRGEAPVRRTRSDARRRAVLGLPPADRGAPVEAATLLLTVPADAWPGCEAAAVAALRADAVPGGVAALDPAAVDAGDAGEPDRRRRRPEAAAEEDGAADRTVAVHLHPVGDLAALADAVPWLVGPEPDAGGRTLAAALDPAALAGRAFGARGGAAVIAVGGLDLPAEADGSGGFGAVAGPAVHDDDRPAAVAAEHLRRLVFAAGPDGDPGTRDAPPGPPSAGGWDVRLIRFDDPGPPAGGESADSAPGPVFLAAAPVADPAAFARGLAGRLPGVSVAAPPESESAGTDAGADAAATSDDDGDGGDDDEPDDGGTGDGETDHRWAAFLASGRTGAAEGGSAPGTSAGGRAVVFAAAATGAAAELGDPAALPSPCAGDAAAFRGDLAARRRARERALAAGGHDATLWRQSESSGDRTPGPDEGDLTWALRVVSGRCEDGDARREAYGLLAAADPAAGSAADAGGPDRGRVFAVLVETLPAAVAAREGEAHVAALLRWADGPADLRAVGAAAAALTPRVGALLLSAVADEDARRGRPDGARLHAVLPLLTALGNGDAAAERVRAAGADAVPALLDLLGHEDAAARRAAVNLLAGPPRLARPGDAAALLDAARAEPDRDLARRLRLLANDL